MPQRPFVMAHFPERFEHTLCITSLTSGECKDEFRAEDGEHHPAELPENGFPIAFIWSRDVEMQACPCAKENG